MSTVIRDIAWKEELYQSDLFAEVYKDKLDMPASSPTSLFNFKDIEDIYNSILINSNLTSFQIKALTSLFYEFNRITGEIDPARLAHFDCELNDDNELLIFRKSSKGLTNIIIHDNECVAFSFIPYDSATSSILKFIENPAETCDFAFLFFSY